MSAQKGSNGIKDGEANSEAFRRWESSVRDFKPYIQNGALKISVVARECALNRDVFYTNAEIRDVLWPALKRRLEKAGVLKARAVDPTVETKSISARSALSDMRVKQIQEENEAVKAENEELRRKLAKFKGVEEALQSTGRLPW
ncbi:hypothetical protein [Roseateles sp.]|uniref:hypothetical protein n=1 Tax=Roseateles sp. TaxID=1971397 RepID=UPI003D0F3CC3